MATPRVAVLSVGGTISQRSDGGVARPGADVEAVLAAATPPGITVAHHAVLAKGSKDLRPPDWQLLAREVGRAVRSGSDGVVLLHGTDTLAYTAAALSFMLGDLGVPVVLTGSMRPGGDAGSDAVANVRDALLVAAQADLAEVVVVFAGDEPRTHAVILRGSRCRKVHSRALAAFGGVDLPALGEVRAGRVALAGLQRPRRGGASVVRDELESRVALVRVTPALTAAQLATLLADLQGVVIEGTGTGHVAQDLVPVLAGFAQRGGAVVMCSQAERGGERLGGYSTDLDASVVPGLVGGGPLTGETALVKLMWTLAHGDWTRGMRTDLAGELREA